MYTHVSIVDFRYCRHLTVSLVRFIFYFNRGITKRPPLISLDALRAFGIRPVGSFRVWANDLPVIHTNTQSAVV